MRRLRSVGAPVENAGFQISSISSWCVLAAFE
jgi:hypothetical protein